MADLYGVLETNYRLNGRASLRKCMHHKKPVLKVMGDRKAAAVTTSMIEEFKDSRLKAGAAPATVNNELALLRRAFNLAIQQDLLKHTPRIVCLRVNNARKGFLYPGDYRRIVNTLDVLCQDVADVVRWLYLLGWRKGEVLGLQWSELNIEEGTVQLPGVRTKNQAHRTVRVGEDLHQLLRRRWETRQGPYVFHRHGRQIRDFTCRWKRAVKAAGRPDLVPHDCRRSFARNAINAGIPVRVIMDIGGWKTRSVFDRYCITDEAQISQALNRISDVANGNQKLGLDT